MRTSRTFSEYGTIQTFRIVRTRNTATFERESIRIFDSRNAQPYSIAAQTADNGSGAPTAAYRGAVGLWPMM